MVVGQLRRLIEKDALHRQVRVHCSPLRVFGNVGIGTVDGSFAIVECHVTYGPDIGKRVESRNLPSVVGVGKRSGSRPTCWINYDGEID